MGEQQEREAVIAAARSFIGTRYRANGKLKGIGVDCGTLLTLSFEEAGVRPPIYLSDYSSQFHLHSTEPRYEKELIRNGAHEVKSAGIADIVLYHQGLQFAHGALVTRVSPLRIIHAFMPSRCVVEGDETEFGVLIGEPKKFFSAW